VITLSQGAYAERIVEKAGLTGCNPCATPLEPRTQLSENSTAPPVDGTEYRSLVGSLRYLVNTRPDLAYAVGYVSRFMQKPTEEHRAAVKTIVRYVAGTSTTDAGMQRTTAGDCKDTATVIGPGMLIEGRARLECCIPSAATSLAGSLRSKG
jgi:hypothetical protein